MDLLRPLGPHGAWALVVLLILRWVADRVDKWADAAIKQAVTNQAMQSLIEHVNETLQRMEAALKELLREIQNGRRG